MKYYGIVIKEYMSIVPKNATWGDILYACEEIKSILHQLCLIKMMVNEKNKEES